VKFHRTDVKKLAGKDALSGLARHDMAGANDVAARIVIQRRHRVAAWLRRDQTSCGPEVTRRGLVGQGDALPLPLNGIRARRPM